MQKEAKTNAEQLYTVTDDGHQVKYPDSNKITTDELEKFVEADYQFRIGRAIERGQNPLLVQKRTPVQILNSMNSSFKKSVFRFNGHCIQPLPDTDDEDSDDEIADMDHLGKYSADYTTQNEINGWIDLIAVEQDLEKGGLAEEKINLLVECEVNPEGKKKKQIAKEHGLEPQELTMQLQRAKKKSKIILEKAR